MTKAELPTSSYDAIIIGTGQAGPALARRLAAASMTVAIVERGSFRWLSGFLSEYSRY